MSEVVYWYSLRSLLANVCGRECLSGRSLALGRVLDSDYNLIFCFATVVEPVRSFIYIQ